MDLTNKNKAYIDNLSYADLLTKWRLSSIGNPWFQGETGEYWSKRLQEMRSKDNTMHVRNSKVIGW